MKKNMSKILIIFTVICLSLALYMIFGNNNGWIYSGPIQFSTRAPLTRPILCNQKLIILEKINKKSSMSFIKDEPLEKILVEIYPDKESDFLYKDDFEEIKIDIVIEKIVLI